MPHAVCHRRQVGPDITGSQRANLDYLLSNVLDPSAVMAKEYQPTVVRCADGRVITGILPKRNHRRHHLPPNPKRTRPHLQSRHRRIQNQRQIDDARRPPQAPLAKRSPRPRRLRRLRRPNARCRPPPTTSPPSGTARDLTRLARRSTISGPSKTAKSSAKTTGLKKNEFLMSGTLHRRLPPGTRHQALRGRQRQHPASQIRSAAIRKRPPHAGYQCDAGPGWWGKLYEEHGRASSWSRKAASNFVKKGDWNHYEIAAVGSRVSAPGSTATSASIATTPFPWAGLWPAK